MKKTTQTISIFSWKRIILKGFTNKCNVGTEYLISEFVVNSDWRTFGGANQDLKGILIAVSQMFHLFDFFYSGHMCDQV